MKTKEKRNYFTVREFMERTLNLARQDERYPELEEACVLDYQLVSYGSEERLLIDDEMVDDVEARINQAETVQPVAFRDT